MKRVSYPKEIRSYWNNSTQVKRLAIIGDMYLSESEKDYRAYPPMPIWIGSQWNQLNKTNKDILAKRMSHHSTHPTCSFPTKAKSEQVWCEICRVWTDNGVRTPIVDLILGQPEVLVRGAQ